MLCSLVLVAVAVETVVQAVVVDQLTPSHLFHFQPTASYRFKLVLVVLVESGVAQTQQMVEQLLSLVVQLHTPHLAVLLEAVAVQRPQLAVQPEVVAHQLLAETVATVRQELAVLRVEQVRLDQVVHQVHLPALRSPTAVAVVVDHSQMH
jgi:hypothetical protein